jgi:hypothetical protein
MIGRDFAAYVRGRGIGLAGHEQRVIMSKGVVNGNSV